MSDREQKNRRRFLKLLGTFAAAVFVNKRGLYNLEIEVERGSEGQLEINKDIELKGENFSERALDEIEVYLENDKGNYRAGFKDEGGGPDIDSILAVAGSTEMDVVKIEDYGEGDNYFETDVQGDVNEVGDLVAAIAGLERGGLLAYKINAPAKGGLNEPVQSAYIEGDQYIGESIAGDGALKAIREELE